MFASRPWKRKSAVTLVVALVVFLSSLLPPFQSTAYAWKPRTHVYLAQQALLDALDDGKVTIYRVDYANGNVVVEGSEPVVVGHYAVREENLAALRYWEHFNAGVIGPDAYPDILTGQQSIHPDNAPDGPYTDLWLDNLMEASRQRRDDPWVRAFVLGNYAHAAGDMFGHTFVNHFSGGEFSLDYNAVKHVVLEGYIDKRTPSPTYPNYSIQGLEDFIYTAMIDARPEANSYAPPLAGDGSELSIPAMFSRLRLSLEGKMRTYHNKMDSLQAEADRLWGEVEDHCGWTTLCNFGGCFRQYDVTCDWYVLHEAKVLEREVYAGTVGSERRYLESWIADIESGLRAWPSYSHRIAQAVVYNPNGVDLDEATSVAEEYAYRHLISMMGAPDFVGLTAEAIDDITDAVMSTVPEIQREFARMKRDLYFYLISEATGIDARDEYEAWKGYLKSPENYFDEVMGVGEGAPINLESLNRDILHMSDEGYSDPSETYSYYEFPAAYNTVTMIKLMLMEWSEVRRLMQDLGSPIAVDEEYWSGASSGPLLEGLDLPFETSTADDAISAFLRELNGEPHVMQGFLRSLDSDNQWCRGETDMLIAADPDAYVQVFMRQEGQELVGDCPDYAAYDGHDLTSTGQPGEATATQVAGIVATGGDNLRVRAEPSPNAEIIGRLPSGSTVTTVARSADNRWLRIPTDFGNSGFGWVMAEYVSLSEPISALPVFSLAKELRPGDEAVAGVQPPTGKIAVPVFDPARETYDVWLVNADGTNLRKVVSEASAPALSPNGSALAYRRWKRDDRGIVIAGADGSNPLRLTSNLEDIQPSFSPDGKRVVFSSYRHGDRRSRIYYVWFDERNYTAWEWGNGGYYGEDPSWAADGGIVYVGLRPGPEMRAMEDGGGNVRPIMPPDQHVQSPAVSPDGSRIAYMTQADGDFEVFAANRDGSNPIRLTRAAGKDGLPVWSPDGNYIAFVSDRGGQWAIWLMRADGSGQAKLVNLPGSVDGRVRNEMPYLTNGWVEEQLSWSR